MKEYEIIFTYLNGCSGSAHPQRTFDEAEIADTDAYVRSKHGKEFDKFEKQVDSNGQIVYTFDNGTICYRYEFTEI